MKSLDLDVATPEEVPAVLRGAADKFRESHADLQSVWQDPVAGSIWHRIAGVLERAAQQIETRLKREDVQ